MGESSPTQAALLAESAEAKGLETLYDRPAADSTSSST